MATVRETIEAEIARLQAELAAIPVEAHSLEQEVWAKIKAFFGTDTTKSA
jgi:hypothetical protein